MRGSVFAMVASQQGGLWLGGSFLHTVLSTFLPNADLVPAFTPLVPPCVKALALSERDGLRVVYAGASLRVPARGPLVSEFASACDDGRVLVLPRHGYS